MTKNEIQHRARSCSGKARYPKRKAIAQAARKTKKTGMAHTAYYCKYCGRWHVGKDKTNLFVWFMRHPHPCRRQEVA